MEFYFARGLQVAGLCVVGFGLVAGITGAVTLFRELGLAASGAGLFYAGRLIEGRGN